MAIQNKNGQRDEDLACKIFKRYGYWSHNIKKGADGGQPCDIVAINKSTSFLVDVKNVRKEEASFTFSRIEPNQKSSFDYAKNGCGIKNVGFVIFFERDMLNPRWLSYDQFLSMDSRKEKSANISILPLFETILKKIDSF